MAAWNGIRAVIFDLGGTLLEFQVRESRVHLRAGLRLGHTLLAERGVPVPAFPRYRRWLEWRLLIAYLRSRMRRGELNPLWEIERTHREMGLYLDRELIDELGRCYHRPVLDITRTADQAAATLAELRRRNYRLALISNTIAPPPGLDEHLAARGLLEFFPVRVYSCVIGVPKPHPRIFRTALEMLRVPPAQAIYVGDKPRIDVAGARGAGLGTVLRVAPGHPQPRGAVADHVIHELSELLDLLPPRAAP